VGDDLSTRDLSPDGAEVMAFRSNVPAMARFVLRRLDPDFATRRDYGKVVDTSLYNKCLQDRGGFEISVVQYSRASRRAHTVSVR
jgi:hypothetical protein